MHVQCTYSACAMRASKTMLDCSTQRETSESCSSGLHGQKVESATVEEHARQWRHARGGTRQRLGVQWPGISHRECRAAQGHLARPEEAREPSSGTNPNLTQAGG